MEYFSNFTNEEIILLSYLLIINIISFIIMGIDKLKAKKEKYRISENALIGLALIGGSSGTLLGMTLFRHKTSKNKFYIGVPLIYVITNIILIMIFNYLR